VPLWITTLPQLFTKSHVLWIKNTDLCHRSLKGSIPGKKEESPTSDWWPGAYLKGLTIPRDLRQSGTFGGP
jgi:hypothetical protein